MAKNQPANVPLEPGVHDEHATPTRAGDSPLLYFVGCGIFWRNEGQRDALRELMSALHHIDPMIRCVGTQMLSLYHSARVIP